MKDLFRFIGEIFVGKQSRKVAFGIWGFWVATGFRAADKIPPEMWWWCFVLSALLVGFGTIVDDLVRRLGDRVVDIVGNLVSIWVNRKTIATENKPKEESL